MEELYEGAGDHSREGIIFHLVVWSRHGDKVVVVHLLPRRLLQPEKEAVSILCTIKPSAEHLQVVCLWPLQFRQRRLLD